MKRLILLGVLLLSFLGYASVSLFGSLTPYKAFAEAKASGQHVQIKGRLDATTPPAMQGQDFCFTLDDEAGTTLPVRYQGAKPEGFDEAHHIVAVGHWENNAFLADKLLLKCPSKYEREKG